MRRAFVWSLVGCSVLAGAAFLPWLRLGEVGLAGVPDPAGFFVLGLGVLGLLLSAAGLWSGRDTRPGLVLVGLAGLTTLAVVWLNGPATIADRAQARAEAVALVDNVAVESVPPVRIGAGLVLGLAGAATVAAVALAGVWSRTEP
ncbi:MAG TPA: hypothetical protein VM032_02630 [Vicinamibacterales bacterium]|nr:hypothetical protein [Vicinamibacterales bacterium]